MISRKTTVSAVALLLASAGAAAAFPATATTDLNLRSGPGTGYSVVDRLEAGDTVEIVGTRGSWYQTAEGGWASGNYLDAQGGRTTYYGESYGGSDYGPVAFYYDDSPYYYDNAGFYFYIDGGRRHRVDHGWFRDRDRSHFRYGHAKYRTDIDRHFGGGKSAGNWKGNGGYKGGKQYSGDANISAGASVETDGYQGSKGESWQKSGDANLSAGASVEGGQSLREERASTEGPPRGGNGPRLGGQGSYSGPAKGQGSGQYRPQQKIPGGGY